MKNKQAKPGDKGFYLNEQEAIAFGTINSSLSVLFFTALFIISSAINQWFLLGIIIMVVFYNLISLLCNYFRFLELIKRREDGKKKKGKRKRRKR